jgi:hypothetical protein
MKKYNEQEQQVSEHNAEHGQSNWIRDTGSAHSLGQLMRE